MKRFFLCFITYYVLFLAIISATVVWAPSDWFGKILGHAFLLTIIVACKPLDQLGKTMGWVKSTAIYVPFGMFVCLSEVLITDRVHGRFESISDIPTMQLIPAAAFILVAAYLVRQVVRSLFPDSHNFDMTTRSAI